MDIVLEDVMRKFQAERGLSDLTREQLFETFAAYCVVGQFYEDDFEPDDLRMGSKPRPGYRRRGCCDQRRYVHRRGGCQAMCCEVWGRPGALRCGPSQDRG